MEIDLNQYILTMSSALVALSTSCHADTAQLAIVIILKMLESYAVRYQLL